MSIIKKVYGINDVLTNTSLEFGITILKRSSNKNDKQNGQNFNCDLLNYRNGSCSPLLIFERIDKILYLKVRY